MHLDLTVCFVFVFFIIPATIKDIIFLGGGNIDGML